MNKQTHAEFLAVLSKQQSEARLEQQRKEYNYQLKVQAAKNIKKPKIKLEELMTHAKSYEGF